mgnify:CR=1 FL=1
MIKSIFYQKVYFFLFWSLFSPMQKIIFKLLFEQIFLELLVGLNIHWFISDSGRMARSVSGTRECREAGENILL